MRVKLCDKYKEEREIICQKLISILDLKDGNSFLLSDLDNDIAKQTAILDMKDEIQKCFAVSAITPFIPNRDCKRPYLNIVRGILRQQGYIFEGNNSSINEEKRTIKYIIFRNKIDIHGKIEILKSLGNI
jgi:hypothetical protein